MADFKTIWNNKKQRNIIILSILLVILAISLAINIPKLTSPDAGKGMKRTYLCPKCEFTVTMIITDKGEVSCPKCKNRVGFAWKCRKCQREFAVKPAKITKLMSKKELMAKKKSEAQCINCNSFDTYPLAK